MDYWDNLKTYNKYGRRSVYEILSLNPNIPEDWEIINREYKTVDIDKVIIDGDTYTNYGDFQFIWEKAYVREPKRSCRGNLGNLNSHATFITGHLVMNFSIMSIDDYRSIMRKDLEKNEFVVDTYDIIYNERVKIKMYFTTQQIAKLFTIAQHRFNGSDWEDWIEIVGVHDYTVDLVGTNNDLDLVSVTYHLNPPKNSEGYPIVPDQSVGEEDVYKGEELVIGGATDFQQETFGGLYKFTKWNISPSGGDLGNYVDGYAYTINTNLVLYAQWEATTEHTLTFNYGLADPAINESSYTYETNRTVVKDKSIGTLPIVEAPKVKYKDIFDGKDKEKTDVYFNPQWWKVPQKVKKVDENGNDISNTLVVYNNEPYWVNRDSTIYLLYNVTKYDLTLYLDGMLYQSNSIEYNTPTNLPQLVRLGYTFDGWYYTSDFKNGTKFSGNMPPYSLTLYARWIENKQ